MRNKGLEIILIAFILLSVGAETHAGDIYAFIKSKDLRQAETLITGFSRSFPQAEVSLLDLKGRKDAGMVADFIKAKKPRLIVCLGALAANMAVQAEKDVPIVFSMVINHRRHHALRQKNVTGISMEIPSASLFTQFRMLVPRIRSLGVPFHPDISSEIVKEASEASRKMGMRLVGVRVEEPGDIGDILERRRNEFDGLWMLADTKLYNRRTRALASLIEFSKNRKKPLLAFSEAFLKPGAFFSISIDYSALGSQIALISKRVVQDGTAPQDIPVALPIGTYTVINRQIAESMLGNSLDESMYDEVDKIYPDENGKG